MIVNQTQPSTDNTAAMGPYMGLGKLIVYAGLGAVGLGAATAFGGIGIVAGGAAAGLSAAEVLIVGGAAGATVGKIREDQAQAKRKTEAAAVARRKAAAAQSATDLREKELATKLAKARAVLKDLES